MADAREVTRLCRQLAQGGDLRVLMHAARLRRRQLCLQSIDVAAQLVCGTLPRL